MQTTFRGFGSNSKGAFVSSLSTNRASDSEAEMISYRLELFFFCGLCDDAPVGSSVICLRVGGVSGSSGSGVVRPPRDVTASRPSSAS